MEDTSCPGPGGTMMRFAKRADDPVLPVTAIVGA